MPEPRVWAPHAQTCAVNGEPMRRDGAWWESPRPLAAGARYRFVVDGRGPMPDPRSRSQPAGVHGPSEVVALRAPSPFTPPPLADWVLYELHVGTFSDAGTFAGMIEHLDHLVALGVNAVEIMPVAEFPGTRGWGYDGVDLFAPHHAYGGPEGLQALVDACHAGGLAVVLDVVYNHLGPDGNYLADFGPYFTDRYETPWGAAVNLDGAGSDEVRAFIVDNARMWLYEFGADGLRLDALHALFDASPTHMIDELATACRGKVLIAEHEKHDPGLDGHWYDDFHHALHALLTGERDGYYARFGAITTLADAIAAGTARQIGFAQNHDQIGNRAVGERLCHLVSDARARMAAALVLLGPCTPMLFQGEEWAASSPFQYFTDHQNPGLAEAVRRGRRNEFKAFGWKPDDVPDPQARETFERSRLRWEERDDPRHASMLEFHRDLIALRREIRHHETEVHTRGETRLEMRRGDLSVVIDLAADHLDIRT